MKFSAMVLFTAALAWSIGCSQTKEFGKSTGKLFTGTASQTIDRTPAQIEQAIDATIADLKFIRIGSTTKPSKEQIETAVISRNSQDEKVVFIYTPVTATTTEVGVSTGPFGSSDLRQEAWETLRARLGLLPALNQTVASPTPTPTPAPADVTPPPAYTPPPTPAPAAAPSSPQNPLAPSAPANPLAPNPPATQPVPPPPAMQM